GAPTAGGSNSSGGPSPKRSIDAAALELTADNTKIEWVGTKPGGQHKGGFKQLAGTVDLAGNDPTKASIVVEIETDSLFSDNPGLTGHLKTPDFFEVKTYPKA